MTKILVIEDDPEIRENIQDILELENFEIVLAENGRVGLEKAHNKVPDLIICDVMMPEINGFEVLKALRHQEKTASIPLIFLTAKADRMDFRQGMELGADDYLTKPFTPKELRQAINTRLAKKIQIEQKYETKIKEISEQLTQGLYQDRVTHLPNRLSLREKFQEICQLYEVQIAHNQFIPVLCLSLDRFSQIQSNLGYDKTDLLLNEVAERLKSKLDSNADLIYLGAEEFAILFPPVPSKQIIIETITELQAEMNQSYRIESEEIFLSTSIGISLYQQDGKEIEKLLTNAKKALQQSRKIGTNSYEFYQGLLEVGTARKLSLENDLRLAVERNEFELYYQPQVSLKTKKIIGCEVLLRWHHPIHRIVSPNIFIPIAEELGLINDIGKWVFRQACSQIKLWQRKGLPDLRVSVNISAIQFNRSDFRQDLISSLVEYSLNPKQIELELTETQLVKDIETAKKRLKSLKSLDFLIAIDDFGTGYSSLKYLQELPFDTLKIDRIFIQNIDSNPSNFAITTAVIEMAHSLDLQVIAEGVETSKELKLLEHNQCDVIQGYLFSRPLPSSEFEELLKSGKCLD